MSEGCRAGVLMERDDGGQYSVCSKLRLGTPVMRFYYTYILRSETEPPHFYTGFTEDLDARLKHHNSGGDPHTAKYRPWHIKTAVAFTNREKALAFERYLKSSSGRAFAKKRL